MSDAVQRLRANVAELTVSELATAIKATLEDGFGHVRLRGEISGFRGPHSSGHCYFALKDDKAKIEAVIWRGSYPRLKVKPEEGLEVIATGRITTFPGKSTYQIVIEALEPAGIGAMMAQIEERKKRLGAEGLFDEARKRKLPYLPRVVGIVTSPTGAVIRDMLHGFAERFPVRVIVWPVRVQGESSAAEVANAVRGFNALPLGGAIPRPDVLIVARGGGSLEDLWGFNDEAVVRAVAASEIPLVSAVGHETDWTLIDLAADARAPTPTKAAEWVVPKHADLIEATEGLGVRLHVAARRLIDGRRTELRAVARGLPRPQALVALPRQRLDGADRGLTLHFTALVRGRRSRTDAAAARLPRPRDLVALPRQRFDSLDRRLAPALLINVRVHAHALGKIAARLTPRLVALRVERDRERVHRLDRRGREALGRIAGQRRLRLERSAARLSLVPTRRLIGIGAQRLKDLAGRAQRAFVQRIGAERRRLAAQSQLLATLDYHNVLKRGFALVRDAAGRPIRSIAGAAAGSLIDVEVGDGRFGAVVNSSAAGDTVHPVRQIDPAPAAEANGEPSGQRIATEPTRPAPAVRSRRPPSSEGGQGSLF